MAESPATGDRFGLVGATLGERYYVERPIAEGGFAVVYRAHQLALERPVALKVLKTPPGLDEVAEARFRERFAAEAKTIARLKHPYIVTVHDFGVAHSASGELAPWMALEWLDGETLESDLERRRGQGGRTVAEAVALLRPVLEALAYAHRYGVVHRDIKPANMMAVMTERGPILRMLDFGIAKIVQVGATDEETNAGQTKAGPPHAGSTGGTSAFSPHYASPEQVTFTRTGPFTDVHALGLVLTEILTDQPPYSDGPDEQIFEQVMSTARPTPRSRGKSVGRVEKIVEKAVALSPSRRWRDAGELLQALDAVVTAGEVRRNTRTDEIDRPDDLDAEPAPPPTTFAERRTIAVVGGLAIAVAVGVLVRVLGLGATPTSVAEEFAATSQGTRRPPHPMPKGEVTPWIVPLAAPAPPPVTALGPGEPATPPLRRTRALAVVDSAEAAPTVRAGCKVTVNSVPWSEVWIDGKSIGTHTPVVGQDVACGRHQLEFKRSDLQIDQVEAVLINPGETFKRRFTLATVGE
jgi:serine/threonine protein kinase